jgi:predicted dehydrogenase
MTLKRYISMSKPIERRQFVQTLSAGLAAGMAAGGYFSSSVHGADSKKLGWALVGLGSLSTNQIAPGLLNSEHCKLTAIVTGTPKKEKVWADKYGVGTDHIYNYETFDKIANDDTVDVIYIVLPNSMHCEYVKRAAKAGKHVFCEKPMANTSQECREMIAACQSAQRHLGIGYRCQFQPHNMACIEFAQKKAFGDLRHIDAGFGFKIGDPTQWRLRKSLAGGGALMDVGIYALQACRCLTNEEPIEIVAQETKTDPVKFAEVDESINWSMKFPSGVMANCSTSYNYNGINRYRAYADKGDFGLDPAYSYEGIQGSSSKGKIEAPKTDQFAAEMDAFAKTVKLGEPNRVPGEEGLLDLLAIEAIYKSIATGQSIEPEKVDV